MCTYFKNSHMNARTLWADGIQPSVNSIADLELEALFSSDSAGEGRRAMFGLALLFIKA